jgi:UV DNA damage endonuclease
MKPVLGLVCLTSDKTISYRTLQKKTYDSLDNTGKERKLTEIYTENVRRLALALKYCKGNGIGMYRIGSGLFPFSEGQIGTEVFDGLVDDLRLIGEYALVNKIRLTMHPDQFCVLSSDKESVIENSIVILEQHAKFLDALRQPKSPYACLNIHGGAKDRSNKLIESIRRLPANIRSRLTLENDEHSYSVESIHHVCEATGVALVYDVHHDLCKEKLPSYDHHTVEMWVKYARDTWSNPDHQLVHISNGDSGLHDRKHSEYVHTIPEAYRNVPYIDVEAKGKELAIRDLNDWWLRDSQSLDLCGGKFVGLKKKELVGV